MSTPADTTADRGGDLRVHHVGIVVDDIDEAARFMRDVLDLRVREIVDLGPGAGRVAMVDCGPVHLELIDYSDPVRRESRLGSDAARIEHIAFDVDDAERTRGKLEAHGVRLDGPVKVRPDCTTFFTTPESCDGVRYQFRQPAPSAPRKEINDARA
ncbi:hypothetical protein GCM10017786_08280 [Amycolatopsis deserti]|uniref:VOC domain-containing protein n=1 Tax=Amycolatopsis deserti TaxID=185696 RepID=A0ABQ3IEW6_9PSEU|nr:VOC family protein [Amycolatopsis deserti]GHE80488.1 hypothetical protein GCM10017786_08280 [Amycolatopsis deserti]